MLVAVAQRSDDLLLGQVRNIRLRIGTLDRATPNSTIPRDLASPAHSNTVNQSYGSGSQNISNSRSSGTGHFRSASNPFDIIYDPNQAPHPANLKAAHKTPSYLEIEREFNSGKSPSRAVGANRYSQYGNTDHYASGSNRHNFPPTVTVIDDRPKRGNLVVSREASLRHRNTIRRRNKMVRRDDLEKDTEPLLAAETSVKKSRKLKLSFVFPIKRKTSFKYRSLRSLRFSSQKDMDEYFLMNNLAAMMKDVLPHTMMTYEYSRLIKVHPNLHAQPAYFAISRSATFTEVQDRSGEKPSPLRGQRIKQSDLSGENLDTRPLSKEHSSTESEQHKRAVFVSTVSNEYRHSVFSGKFTAPPKIEAVRPFEAEILSPEEKVSIETKLALEVLLRRTLAAKIDYRLRSDRNSMERSRKAGLDASPLSSRLSHGPKLSHLSHLSHLSGNSKRPSVRNITTSTPKSQSAPFPYQASENSRSGVVPSVSENFPSPQVSLALFESYEPPVLDPKRQSPVDRDNGPRSAGDGPAKAHINVAEFPPANTTTTTTTFAPLSPANMFVNDFNKTYYESERRREEHHENLSNLSNLNMFSLRPRNRSDITLSSGPSAFVSQSPLQPGLNQSHDRTQSGSNKSAYTHSGSHNETKLSGRSSYSSHRVRHSKSTPNTSILHSLDSVANIVTEYLRQEGLEYDSEGHEDREVYYSERSGDSNPATSGKFGVPGTYSVKHPGFSTSVPFVGIEGKGALVLEKYSKSCVDVTRE